MVLSRRASGLFTPLFLSLMLSACGGGGGASGSSSSGGSSSSSSGGVTPPPAGVGYTLSQTSFSAQAPLTGATPAGVDITVSITSARTTGMGGYYSDTGVSQVLWNPAGTATGTISLSWRQPMTLAPGTYTDSIVFGYCVDVACSDIENATATTILATYTVTAVSLPTVTVSPSSIAHTALAGDAVGIAPITLDLAVANPVGITPAGYSSSTSTNGVYSVQYTGQSPSAGQLAIVLKPPYTLSEGVYTDTVQVRMCLDLGCANPLQVTPSTISVTYTVTSTIDGPNGYTTRNPTVKANDVSWSPTRGILYLAVPSSASTNPDTITEYNPVTGEVGASIASGLNPNLLAISDDDSLLYAGESGLNEIRRFTLSPLAEDISIPLGVDTSHPANDPLFARDLQVQPGNPRVLAVRRSNPRSSPDARGAVLFDDAIQRPEVALPQAFPGVGYLQWDTDGSRLFSNGHILAVDANGLTAQTPLQGISGRFVSAGGRLYSVDGQVVDVATLATSSIPLDGGPELVAADASVGRLYFLTEKLTDTWRLQIEVFDLATHTHVGTATLPRYQGFSGIPARFARWGPNGLAITSMSGDLILVHGPLMAP